MEILVLDGKNYVKASKAAKDLGYATDYVGQLCRNGQIDSHLIGRTWYVNQEELHVHRVEKKRISRVKAREQAKKTIEEHRQKSTETINVSKNIAIQYEEDHKELIPETRRLNITSAPQKHYKKYEEVLEETHIENKGEKVLMSGSINVVDVTDGPIDTETVFLTPSRIQKTVPGKPQKREILKETTIPLGVIKEETSKKKGLKNKGFLERLGDLAVVSEDVTVDIPVQINSVTDTKKVYTTPVLVAFLLIMLVIFTLPLDSQINFNPNSPIPFVDGYHFSFKNLL